MSTNLSMMAPSKTTAPTKKIKHTIQSLLNEEDQYPSSTTMQEQVASAKPLLSLSKQTLEEEQQKQVPVQKDQQASDSWFPAANSVPTAPVSYAYPSQYYHAPMQAPPVGMLPPPSLYYPSHSYNYYPNPPQSVQPQYMMQLPSLTSTGYPLPPHQSNMIPSYPSSSYYSMPPSYGTSNLVNTPQVVPPKSQTTSISPSSSAVPSNLNTNSSGVSVVNISDESVAKSYKVKEVESKYVKGKVYVVDPKSKKKDIAPNTALFHITQSLLRDKFKVDSTSNIKLVSKKGGKIHVVHDCKQFSDEAQNIDTPNQ